MASLSFPILFVAPIDVSEAVLCSGLLKRLSDEIPHARFTVVTGPAAAPLFRDLPGLDRLVGLEDDPGFLGWFELWRRVRGRRWGLVLDMRGKGLARALDARRRAVRRPANPALAPAHKLFQAAHVLKVDDDPPSPFLFAGEETEAKVDELLKPNFPPVSQEPRAAPILAIAPAAPWVGRTWPAERFAVTAAELLAPSGPLAGGRMMLIGGREDRWAAEAVRRVISRERLIDLVGRADFLTTFACLRRARLFIGNDTPYLHLAAAAGAPTLGLFGPSDERIAGPWGPNARAIRGPREFEAIKRVDPQLNQAVCHMQDLPTAWVVNAAKRLLAETQGSDHG